MSGRVCIKLLTLQSFEIQDLDAFLTTGKRPRRKVAVILHRIPAALYAAHFGSVLTEITGDAHWFHGLGLSMR
jgi:hypothetical protein